MAVLPRQRVIRLIQERIASGFYLPGMRLPTEQEFCWELGVSRGTVRNALHELIEAKILEMRPSVGCFVPGNSSAPPRGRDVMTFVLPEEHRQIGGLYLSGLDEVASANGIRLHVVILKDDLGKIDEVIREVEVPGHVGIVFHPRVCRDFYEYNSRITDKFETARINYVVIDTPVTPDGIVRGNFVGSDGYTASRDIVDQLVDAGHIRIASLRAYSGIYTADNRFRGIVDQLRHRGIPFVESYHCQIEEDRLMCGQGRLRIHELMALDEPPTALICSCDALAFNVLDELKSMGVRVPQDLSVYGFDDLGLAALLDLSTVAQPFHEMGQRAAELLIKNRSASRPIIRQEFLPCRMISRGTVAPPCRHETPAIRNNHAEENNYRPVPQPC